MTDTSTPTVAEQPVPWKGFKYQPVRGLVDRHVARFLRTQRKNMRRFFLERGHLDLYAQLTDLRKQSNRNFIQKNQSFQRILNEHIARSQPAAPAAEAADTGAQKLPGVPELDVRDPGSAVAVPGANDGGDAVRGVAELASDDVNGPVIEE
jgi:hypothetical protein